jgi:hypothetical protein
MLLAVWGCLPLFLPSGFSYQGYYTRSHQNFEVKRLWAGIVLGWVTPRKVPVLHPLLHFCFF